MGVLHGGQQLQGITPPEHDGLEDWPDLGVSPVLREDVSRVDLSWKVMKGDCSGCDGFPDEMVSKGVVSLLEWGVRHG